MGNSILQLMAHVLKRGRFGQFPNKRSSITEMAGKNHARGPWGKILSKRFSYNPDLIFDVKKLLPTQKNHMQPKGEKVYVSEKCPPLPPEKIMVHPLD